MSLASRIGKLEEKMAPKREAIYFIGWANCTWSSAEGLIRHESESIKDFRKRVLLVTKKQFIWFK